MVVQGLNPPKQVLNGLHGSRGAVRIMETPVWHCCIGFLLLRPQQHVCYTVSTVSTTVQCSHLNTRQSYELMYGDHEPSGILETFLKAVWGRQRFGGQ